MSNNTSETMRKIKSSGTTPEKMLWAALKGNNYQFQRNPSRVPGKPDIVLNQHKTAIFLDGDYWHGNQWFTRGFVSLGDQLSEINNREYWHNKINKNMVRDLETSALLTRQGWSVIRVWGSEIATGLAEFLDLVHDATYGSRHDTLASILVERSFAEFFAGIGLVRMGLEREGWTKRFANDIDPQKYRMYSDQFGADSDFVLADIRSIKGRDIPAVAVATASFPCTDLSLAGGRRGFAGESSSLFWEFVRILKESGDRRPPICLIENVPGFLTSNSGEDIKQAVKALNALGFVVDMFQLDARSFVPQSRERLFLIGIKKELLSERLLERQQRYVTDTRPSKLIKFVNENAGLEWYMRPLPKAPVTSIKLENIVEDVAPESPLWWTRERAEYLCSQMSPKHAAVVVSFLNKRKWTYLTAFRRVRNGRSMAEVRSDGIAGCLRTPKGGSAKQILIRAGYGKRAVRLLTPRECARLMGADDFKIDVPQDEAYFGFGDAVCVSAVEWIAKHYLNPLVGQLIRGRILKKVESNAQK